MLERRPDKGLLGGMLCWPTSEWGDAPIKTPPFAAEWQELGAEVRHTFTDFHLILRVHTAKLPEGYQPDAPRLMISRHQFDPKDLPTVMRKAFKICRTDKGLGL